MQPRCLSVCGLLCGSESVVLLLCAPGRRFVLLVVRRSSALLAARARNKAVSAAIAYAVPRRSARGHCAERRRCRSKLIIGVVAPANPRRKWTDALCDAVPPVFRTSVGRRRAAAAGGHSGGFERDPAGRRRRTGRRPSTTLLIGLAKPGLRRGPERAPRWTDSPAQRRLGRR